MLFTVFDIYKKKEWTQATSLELYITNWCKGPSWSWSYGNWIYHYLCQLCLSLLKLWARIHLMARCTWYNIMW